MYTDLPKTEHVTSHLGVVIAETETTTHSAPVSTVIDLESSLVVHSTAGQPYAFCMQQTYKQNNELFTFIKSSQIVQTDV